MAEEKAKVEARAKEEAQAKAKQKALEEARAIETQKLKKSETRHLIDDVKSNPKNLQKEKEDLYEANNLVVMAEDEKFEPELPELSKEERSKQIKDAKKATKTKSKLKTVGLADLAAMLNYKEMD